MIEKCPDCGGELEKGVIPDYLYGGVVTILRYIKGEKSSFTFPFVRVPINSNFRLINSYRCVKCNRVFLYTDEKETVFSTVQKKFWGLVALILVIMVAIAFLFYFGFTLFIH